uniref:DC1 domain-containing protein n=1 Tax=Quercus lobata TaxID=97700 RepID=A0A7N2L636_QUELO
MKCAVLELEAEFHDHPLTPFWRVKVVCHRHPLHLTHSSFELRESDSRFCLLYVQKVDTRYGLYYCSKCNFVAYLNCAIDWRNREDINLLELKDEENEDAKLDQSVESAAAYKVKNIKVGEDGTGIATEIKHFSHEHD